MPAGAEARNIALALAIRGEGLDMTRHRIVALAAALLSACNSYTSAIPALPVSVEPYEGKSCQQLAEALESVAARAETLRFQLDEEAAQDRRNAPAELLVFGTSWLLTQHLGQRKQREADYARLKGERNALQRVMTAQRCDAARAESATTGASAAAQLPAAVSSAP